MKIEPYLFFEGRCEEALEFYRKTLGAEIIMMMRMKDNPDPQDHARLPAGSENKLLHAYFRIGETTIMASDGQCSGRPSFQGFGLSLGAADQAEAERMFKGLSAGGEVRLPLTKTFFSPCFGMVSDRFGVLWMVIVAQ